MFHVEHFLAIIPNIDEESRYFLTTSSLLPFPISLEERLAAYDNIKKQIAVLEQHIHAIKSSEVLSHSFEAHFGGLIHGQAQLDEAWFLLVHLSEVREIHALQAYHNRISEQVNDFYKRLSLDRRLEKILRQSWAQKTERSERERRLFKMAQGLLPNPFERHIKELAELEEKIKTHTAKIEDNIIASEVSWWRILSADEMHSISDKFHQPFIACFNALFPEKNGTGYAMTLEERYVDKILRYSSNRALRQEIFEANQARCTKQSSRPELDNSLLLQEVFEMRQRFATMIQKHSYFHCAIEHNMMSNPSTLNAIDRQLISLFVKSATKHAEVLSQFAHGNGFASLQAWDIDYFNQKYLQASVGLDCLELRGFFSFATVWHEMLAHFSQLYGLIFENEATLPKWHDDVFVIKNIDAQSLEVLGIIYCDMFARPDKKNNDSTSTIRQALLTEHGVWEPAIICIQTSLDSPNELFFKDIITLFHEFGHALHEIFQRDPLRQAGEHSELCLDFIELPSQLNELWCFDINMLKKLSAGTLPEASIESFVQAQMAIQSLYYLRQLAFALFDKIAHQKQECYDLPFLLNAAYDMIAFPKNLIPITPCLFSHIIDGGYEANYIGYLYSYIYAYQVFEQFQHDHGAPRRFREIVLQETQPTSLRKALEKKFLQRCLDLRPLARAMLPDCAEEVMTPLIFSKAPRFEKPSHKHLIAKL